MIIPPFRPQTRVPTCYDMSTTTVSSVVRISVSSYSVCIVLVAGPRGRTECRGRVTCGGWAGRGGK